MKDWSEHLDSHWFIVALSRNVTRKPQRVLLFGKPAVLVRGPQGDVWAFEDRCPHRGAALSTGRLDANGLVCPYHGWTFAGGGQCVAMPGGTPDGSPIANSKCPRSRCWSAMGSYGFRLRATAICPTASSRSIRSRTAFAGRHAGRADTRCAREFSRRAPHAYRSSRPRAALERRDGALK